MNKVWGCWTLDSEEIEHVFNELYPKAEPMTRGEADCVAIQFRNLLSLAVENWEDILKNAIKIEVKRPPGIRIAVGVEFRWDDKPYVIIAVDSNSIRVRREHDDIFCLSPNDMKIIAISQSARDKMRAKYPDVINYLDSGVIVESDTIPIRTDELGLQRIMYIYREYLETCAYDDAMYNAIIGFREEARR